MVNLSTKTTSVPVPVIQTIFVKPVSYEFRVAEYTKDDKVMKVHLQVQIWEHNEYGAGVVIQSWKDVERIQLPDLG
jgi:hypothetical protein